MWISNTATTAMMLPIVDAISEVLSEQPDDENCLEDDNENNELTSEKPVPRRITAEVLIISSGYTTIGA